MKITLDADELMDLLDDLEPVDKKNWRHGHKDTYVFQKDGKHYMVDVDVHHDEGWQLYDGMEAIEVEPIQYLATKWVPVKKKPCKVKCSGCRCEIPEKTECRCCSARFNEPDEEF